MFLFQYDVGNFVHNSKKIPNLPQSLEKKHSFAQIDITNDVFFWGKNMRVPIFPKNIFCKLFKIISYGIS